MDRANYTDNGKGRYPLSTEGLEFIQSQIELIYNVAQLYGPNYILKPSTAMVEGVIVVNGEMMPLQGTKADYIAVTETSETLTADGSVFENARVRRVAHYVASSTGEGCYEASQFKKLTTIEEMTPHLMPKGAIVMWSGAINAIPKGWALCNGENETPNLSGRFIVGVGKADYKEAKTTYQLNKTGGYEEITLTAAESYYKDTRYTANIEYKGIKLAGSCDVVTKITGNTTEHSATAHSNIPPYYVLAYIMKTV